MPETFASFSRAPGFSVYLLKSNSTSEMLTIRPRCVSRVSRIMFNCCSSRWRSSAFSDSARCASATARSASDRAACCCAIAAASAASAAALLCGESGLLVGLLLCLGALTTLSLQAGGSALSGELLLLNLLERDDASVFRHLRGFTSVRLAALTILVLAVEKVFGILQANRGLLQCVRSVALGPI